MITQERYESVSRSGKSSWADDCKELLIVTTDTSVYGFFFHEGRLDLYRSFVVSHHEFVVLQKTLCQLQGRTDMLLFERTASVAKTSAGVVRSHYGFGTRKHSTVAPPVEAPYCAPVAPRLPTAKPAKASQKPAQPRQTAIFHKGSAPILVAQPAKPRKKSMANPFAKKKKIVGVGTSLFRKENGEQYVIVDSINDMGRDMFELKLKSDNNIKTFILHGEVGIKWTVQ